MALNDLSGVGGTGSSGIVSGVGGTGVLLTDVANSDTVEYRDISLAEFTAKALTLSANPLVSGKVQMDLLEGPPLRFGIDYTVAGTSVSWTGVGLDGKIASGDKLRITYFKA